jgi:hypothetical protein
MQKPAARGGQHQREGAQQLREQPPPFPARVIEVGTVPELKLKYVVRARERRPQRRGVDLPGSRAAHSICRLRSAVLRRTIRPVRRHVVGHALVLPVQPTEDSPQSGS